MRLCTARSHGPRGSWCVIIALACLVSRATKAQAGCTEYPGVSCHLGPMMSPRIRSLGAAAIHKVCVKRLELRYLTVLHRTQGIP